MIDNYVLDRYEIPVRLDGTFNMPYPSIFLDEHLSVRNSILAEVFEKTALEWYDDLNSLVAVMESSRLRTWCEEVFLKKKPQLTTRDNRQYFGSWEDLYRTNNQGFPQVLSISRNGGGTLFFAPEEHCRVYAFLNQATTGLRFPEKKARFLGYEFDQETQSVSMHAFSQHNIDYLPGALFLRNWAVNAINEALIDLDKQHVCFDDYLLD